MIVLAGGRKRKQMPSKKGIKAISSLAKCGDVYKGRG